MLDSKLQLVKNHFGIATLADWQDVEPRWILGLDGIGRVTLDYIRMNLAAKGVTLKGDATPEYWKQHLSEVRMLQTMENEEFGEAKDVAVINPFVIAIDSAEQQPFTFQGLTTDAADGGRPLIVPTEWKCLGRGEQSYGDYSIIGHEGRICIERKGIEDACSTILGWSGRRERFERELANFNESYRAYVIVEASLGTLVRSAPQWGKKTAEENAKIIFRSIRSWKYQFPNVQWEFCDDRRLAEVVCFRTLETYWRKESL